MTHDRSGRPAGHAEAVPLSDLDSISQSGMRAENRARFPHPALADQLLQRVELVGFGGRLVPADAVDPRKAHGDAGFMPSGGWTRRTRPRTPAISPPRAPGRSGHGVVAHPAVELAQLLVGEAEIGLADRQELTLRARGRTYSRNRSEERLPWPRCAYISTARRSADRASISTTGLSAGRQHRGCRCASASGPRCDGGSRAVAQHDKIVQRSKRSSGDRSMRLGLDRAIPCFEPRAALGRGAAARRSSAPIEQHVVEAEWAGNSSQQLAGWRSCGSAAAADR